MEKAKDWEESIEKYCDKSLLGCNNPDVNCITMLDAFIVYGVMIMLLFQANYIFLGFYRI